MKYLIKIFWLIFLLSFISLAQGDCKAELSINTDKDSADIYLNSNFIGKGKISREINDGEYVIKVVENSAEWGSRQIIDTINASCNSTISKNYRFNSDVFIQTKPQNVYVFHNDSLIGHTPLFLTTDKNLQLTFQKQGYETKALSTDELRKSSTVQLNFSGQPEDKLFFEKDIFKLLLGSLIVLGGTTAYFKLKADDKFEEYQLSGDQDLLNITRKYDLISGISFGLAQINFGVLLYYFLIE